MLGRIFHYLKPYRRQTFLAVFYILIETILEIIVPFIFAMIVDNGIANGDLNYVFLWGGVMILAAFLAFFAGLAGSHYSSVSGNGLGAELRKAQYEKIQKFSLSNWDKYPSSSLLSRLTNDVIIIQTMVTNGFRPLFRGPIMIVMAIVFSFILTPSLAVIFIVVMPILTIGLVLIILKVRPLYKVLQKSFDRLNRTIQENITAIKVVKAYVTKDLEVAKFQDVNMAYQGLAKKSFHLTSLNNALLQASVFVSIIAILFFGGQYFQIGVVAIGAITGLLTYVLQLMNNLVGLSNLLILVSRSLASMIRIEEILNEKLILENPLDQGFKITRGQIEFKNVSFKYQAQAENYVLKNLNFKIEPGLTVGITGPTGSSKSSLVHLIPRLYDVSEGEVLIDGINIQNYTFEEIFLKINIVYQNNSLFTGTIKENLLWGNQKATDEEIQEVLRISCSDEIIAKLTNGLETVIGQSGINLSGGQKQRLSLARALLRQPKILIIDDGLNAVDTMTDKKIRNNLKSFLPNTTKIIVSQRVASILDADQIIVINEGEINGVGPSEQLLVENKIFMDMYETQKLGAKTI